jgi:hypothetical protein
VFVKMVKSKKISNVQKRPKTKNKTRMSKEKLVKGLDEAATQWARLLNDPCNAPLAHGCFPTAMGGMLQRFEADFLVSTSGTSTAGAMLFSPGMVVASGATGQGSVLYLDSASDTTAFTSWSIANASQPGYNNVLNTSGVRTIAACAQIMWPGSELNRSGVVGLGCVPATIITPNVGGSFSVSSLRTCCPMVVRMPESVAEVKWRPGELDEKYDNPNFGGTAANGDGRNSLLITYSGIPVSTGVRIRLVVVYEMVFGSNQGTVINNTTPPGPQSKNTVNEIFHALDTAGNWAYQLATGPVGNLAWNLGSNLIKRAPNVLALM